MAHKKSTVVRRFLCITAGVAVLGVGAWAVYFATHFSDSGLPPRTPVQGHAGETWWIVLREGEREPVTLGDVLSMKAGTAQEGGIGNMVYTVLLDRDVTLTEGRDVVSARRIS